MQQQQQQSYQSPERYSISCRVCRWCCCRTDLDLLPYAVPSCTVNGVSDAQHTPAWAKCQEVCTSEKWAEWITLTCTHVWRSSSYSNIVNITYIHHLQYVVLIWTFNNVCLQKTFAWAWGCAGMFQVMMSFYYEGISGLCSNIQEWRSGSEGWELVGFYQHI